MWAGWSPAEWWFSFPSPLNLTDQLNTHQRARLQCVVIMVFQLSPVPHFWDSGLESRLLFWARGKGHTPNNSNHNMDLVVLIHTFIPFTIVTILWEKIVWEKKKKTTKKPTTIWSHFIPKDLRLRIRRSELELASNKVRIWTQVFSSCTGVPNRLLKIFCEPSY